MLKQHNKNNWCVLFRVLLVLLELLVSQDQEEDPDPRDPREPLDREVSL